MLSPSTLSLLVGVLVLLSWLFYRSLLPIPIPGIPYTQSALRLFGDTPALLKYQAETEEFTGFFINKCRELQSPIAQVFMEPLRKPWVIIADSVTTENILTRRLKEFDVSPWFTGIFEATLPGSHLHLHTNDQWRQQRKTVNDIMSGQFLQNVASPRAYASCLEMIELWTEKVRLGGGETFSVGADVEHLLLDSIWAIAFGSSIGSTNAQKSLLASLTRLPQTDGSNSPGSVVIFPEASRPAAYNTIITIADSHLIPIKFPFGPTVHKLAFRFDPRLRKAAQDKEAIITERLSAALENATSAKPKEVACAADLLIRREQILAGKEDRPPLYDTPTLRDELYTFLQAGNDTTATTLQWGLKYLTANPDIQAKLRAALSRAFGPEHARPTALQIATTHIPYLDATIEEIFRCSTTAGAVSRQTTVDCTILGYHVPANTNVMMITSGPSYRSAPIHHQSTGPGPKQVTSDNPFKGNWDPDSLSGFEPERWLYTDEVGRTCFTVRAGPAHAMGTGPRHCFGKPMATLILRVFLTLILHTFDLQTLPRGLAEFKAVQRLTHRPKTVYLRLRQRLGKV